jgi:hypothetical protein
LKNLSHEHHFMEDLTLHTVHGREEQILALFRHQAKSNEIYKNYLSNLSIKINAVNRITEIPFLPISFFKSSDLKTGDFVADVYFESSGTTGAQTSRHGIRDIKFYLENATNNFKEFYGDPSAYCFLALLPSYLERSNSSLVAMADHLMKLSGHPENGFFMQDAAAVRERLVKLEEAGQKTILLGVSFALLDFAEKFACELRHTIVMETGGMKGRRKEITRDEMHAFLIKRLGLSSVHAEYGMTELQSQAYSSGDGFFRPSSTMEVLLRSADDPFELWTSSEHPMRTGVINIIDLANKDTMAFIATDDLGRFRSDGSFEILGRIDHADIRGCSQLAG